MITAYEDRLDSDLNWALDEAERFFRGRSFLHKALRRLTGRLRGCGIAHAVAGEMAFFCHGIRYVTERLDILVTAEGLREIDGRLDGWGYVRVGESGRQFRDDECRITIVFVITGESPGGRAPTPVSFPDPASVAVERAGLWILPLPPLIELSLTAAMSRPDRLSDLAFVVQSILRLRLPRDFANQLNPYVRPKFEEIWDGIRWDAPLE